MDGAGQEQAFWLDQLLLPALTVCISNIVEGKFGAK
jgi:hypothetical protein